MSATRGTLPRADRTPLRNVQNQMSTSPWQTPTKSASLKKNVSQNKNLCRLSGSVDDFAAITSTATDIRSSEDGTGSLNENQGNVTFKSFMCTGGDVELSADSVMSDESVVVGALTLEDCPHTFSVTTVMCEDTLYDMEKHVDHPYCSHASDEPSLESVTLDTEKKVRGVCSANHTDAAPDSAGSCQTEAVSASELEDITVKSFSCPGGEIEIADASLAQEESFNVIIGTLKEEFRSVEDESEILDEHAELTGFPGCCADHPYCRRELEPPAYAHSHAVCTLPVSCEATVVRDDDLTGCMRDLTFIETSTAERPLVVVQGDVKLKSLCCSGGDVELENACGESQVSVLMKEFALVGDLQSSGSDTSEESTAVLSPGGKHADHVYFRSGHGDFHPPASEVTSTGSRLSSSSWECSEMDAPGLADGSQNLKSVVGSGVAVVQSSTELPGELFSSKESVWSLCSSLLHNSRNVAESANVLQGLADVDQPPSANGEQDIASEEPPVLRGPVVSDYPQMSSDNKEAFLDVDGSAESCLSQTTVSPAPDMPAGNFLEGSSNVEGQNADTETSATRDSALGLSGDPDAHADMEVLRSESACDWECELVSLHTQLSSATVPDSLTPRNPALSRSIVEGHGGPASQSRLWPELLDSPIPPPQLNSTALRPSPAAGRRDKALLDLSAMGKGPLQQQLRQMAELLILASGKIAAPATPAPRSHGVEVAATPVEKHSACVWTTPVLQADGSTNTSARVEIVKDIDMSDACTSTDPLLWSVTPSSLESLSRSDLEQKLLTTLVMVEVLSQQLASSHAPCPRVCPAPSDLRDRLVQTDHTQLGQTEPYRELYVSALERIQALEDDHETLGSLHQALHLLRGTMTSVKTEAAQTLCSLKQIESVVSDDQEILSKQVSEMKALYGRCVGSLRKMEKKTQVCLQKRDDMRRTMEEALHERHVVLRVLEQLRAHHAVQVSELQEVLGSQQGLTATLTHTHPQLVELNRTCVESLGAACILLRQKLEDHTAFSEELCRAQQLLQRTHAVLLRLQQRALAAVEQSRQHQAARDAAVQDRCQLESELEQTQCNLRDAHLHVADLNTQVTIMTSEMAVLREQLEEAEDERAQLQRKTTELSATVSSTLASYAFLEQALADETSKYDLHPLTP
uniref:Sperm-associated antigen 5 n=1 Tax=Electrophorus electricus TaxID=8005 RepID=A0A4W4HH87_ELEEL